MTKYKVVIVVDGEETVDVVSAMSPADAIRKVSFDFLYDIEFYNPSDDDKESMDDVELREMAAEVASDGVKLILRNLHNQTPSGCTYIQNDEEETWPLPYNSTITASFIE